MPDMELTPFEEKIEEEFKTIIAKIKDIYGITEKVNAVLNPYRDNIPHLEISVVYPSKTNPSLFIQYEDSNFADYFEIDRKILGGEPIEPPSGKEYNRILTVFSTKSEPKKFSGLRELLENMKKNNKRVRLTKHHRTPKKHMLVYAKSALSSTSFSKLLQPSCGDGDAS